MTMKRSFLTGLALGALLLAGIASTWMPNSAVVTGQIEAGIGRHSSNYIGFLTVTGLVNTVAGTATNMNTSAGRVNVVTGGTAYYITNSLVTANSIVLITPHTQENSISFWVAELSSGLITLKPTSGTSERTIDVSFLVVQP